MRSWWVWVSFCTPLNLFFWNCGVHTSSSWASSRQSCECWTILFSRGPWGQFSSISHLWKLQNEHRPAHEAVAKLVSGVAGVAETIPTTALLDEHFPDRVLVGDARADRWRARAPFGCSRGLRGAGVLLLGVLLLKKWKPTSSTSGFFSALVDCIRGLTVTLRPSGFGPLSHSAGTVTDVGVLEVLEEQFVPFTDAPLAPSRVAQSTRQKSEYATRLLADNPVAVAVSGRLLLSSFRLPVDRYRHQPLCGSSAPPCSWTQWRGTSPSSLRSWSLTMSQLLTGS